MEWDITNSEIMLGTKAIIIIQLICYILWAIQVRIK